MKVVDAFLEKGLLVELDETGPAAGAGRKGRLLRFEPGAYRAVGVECEGRFARVGLADMAGGVQARETIELGDFARTRDLSPLAAAIRRMCAAANGAPVLGVCIGFPANLDVYKRQQHARLLVFLRSALQCYMQRLLGERIFTPQTDGARRIMVAAEAKAAHGLLALLQQRGVRLSLIHICGLFQCRAGF